MSNLDWYVIGGHHHGERHVYHDGRETLRLAELESVFDVRPVEAAAEEITLKSHQYRRVRLYSKRHTYHVWVPDNVSQEDAMGHILRLALADTQKGGTAHFKCGARGGGNTGAGDPQDCDWPVCGCDPHAENVIEALQESGHLVHRDAKP